MELLQILKNVIYTGLDLQVIHFYLNSYKTPARSFAQKLLHRSCSTGVQVTSRWSNCIWTPANQTSPVLLFLSGGRDSQPVAYETLPSAACRTPKRVAKCGSCLYLGNLLRRSRVSDGPTCGVVKCETSLRLRRSCISDAKTCGGMWVYFGPGQPSAEIAQVGHPNMWQNANLVRPGAASSHEMRVNPTIKNLCKIVILKVQLQAWHGSQTAITVGKLRFFNVRCKRSRIGVKLRPDRFWNVRHNRFARNTNYIKLRFYKVRRNPFKQNDCPTSKIFDFPTPDATLSHDMMAERQKLK